MGVLEIRVSIFALGEKICFPLHRGHLRQRRAQGQGTRKGHEEAIDQRRGPSVQQACLKGADQQRVSLGHACLLEEPDLPEASQVTSKVDEKAIMDRKPKFLYDVVSASVMTWMANADSLHTFSCCFFPMCDIKVMSLLLAPSISIMVPRARLLGASRPLISTMSESMLAMARTALGANCYQSWQISREQFLQEVQGTRRKPIAWQMYGVHRRCEFCRRGTGHVVGGRHCSGWCRWVCRHLLQEQSHHSPFPCPIPMPAYGPLEDPGLPCPGRVPVGDKGD